MRWPGFQSSLSLLAVLLALVGCSSLIFAPRDSAVGNAHPGLDGQRSLERLPVAGVLNSSTGCALHYRLYRPAVTGSAAQASIRVILGHGFLRSQQRMAGLAETIAAAGIPVATLDFCNMRFWDGGHLQNGLDMIALARHLDGVQPVIYVGFSAGALAALVAARNDPHALGVVTLDLVDTQGIGERAARDLDKPLIGLAGEPGACNAKDNARAVFAASSRARLMRIEDAGHCDFEAPTDALCELVCADPDQADASRTAELRASIRHQTLAAILTLIPPSAIGPSPRTASAATRG